MKRLLLLLAFVVCSTSAWAELRTKDVLLTDDGILYAVESEPAEGDGDSPEAQDATIHLRLQITNELERDEIIVPASLDSGIHIEPTLAFDETEKRLYIFWQRVPAPGVSELLFISYKDGEWTELSRFGTGGLWIVRMNLRVVITHRVAATDEEGHTVYEPAMIAHAVWWEQHGQTESARYAMLELEGGAATSVQLRDLNELFPPIEETPYLLPEDYDRNILRAPFIFANRSGDAVDVVFANWYTNRYELGTVRPVNSVDHGVIRIPIGFSASETHPPFLRNRVASAYAVSAMRGEGGTLVVYATDEASLEYAALRHEEWSTARSIAVEGPSAREVALEALRGLAARD